MPAEPHAHGAVFLSYASQDAEAAKRICDALRQAGVEVWFDQSELVGGDAWDAKIRRQIKECALLVPIISANTQARTEGYFRLEWRLADQRTHLMAKGRPFLLPVVIDDTRDADAQVPDSFTEVQWTRLPGGETPPAFCARVQKLLGGSDLEPGRPRPGNETRGGGTAPPRKKSRRWLIPGIVVLAVLAGVWQQRRNHEPAGVSPPAETAKVAALSEAQKLVAQARKIYDEGDEINRENIVFAEDLVKRALALDPAEPGAWELAAKLSHALVWYSLDASESRRELLMQQANRARALAPQSVSAQLVAIDARLALNFGRVAVPPGFEQEVRDLLAREPGNWNVQRAWSTLLRFVPGRQEESLAAIRRAVELSNGHPGPIADLINTLVRQRKFAEANAIMARYLTAHPTGRMLCWDVILRLRWQGGPAAAQQSLVRFPTWLLQEDRGLFLAWQTWYWSRDSAKALRAAQAAQRDYVRDFSFYGPRAVLTAQAHELAGSVEAARADWQTALVRAERELATDAQTEDALYWKAWALARLGRTPEARTITAQLRQRNRDGLSAFFKGTSLAALLATTGEIDEALAEISTRLNTLDDSIGVTRPTLELDPAYDAMRGDPRFVALLKQAPAPEKEKPVTAQAADDKSVAVLAFANLSDDKGNEYFSDGISEELLNVLAKIPGLKVTARTSAFYFKGKQVPMAEIARQLGVAYVVEGSVRKAGDKVRITAQLIKAADGFHVWSDTFTRELKDIFAVQDEIAGLIAQNLRLKLDASGPAKKTVHPEAYALLLEGRHLLARRSEADFVDAEKRFRRALEIDADFAPAFAGIADAAMLRGTYGLMEGSSVQPVDFARARDAARRAMELDPTLAEPHFTLGLLHVAEGKFAEADREFAAGFRLNPNHGIAYHWRSLLAAALGRFDEAIADLERAIDLDPLALTSLFNHARLIFAAGRTQEALASMERAIALRPSFFPAAHSVRAVFLLQLGRTDEALAEARLVRQNRAAPTRWWADGDALYVLKQAGAPGEAEAYLRELRGQWPADSHLLGYALLAIGESGEAWRLLAGTNPISWTQLFWAPMMEPHHNTPPLRDLFTRLGALEHYDRARTTIARLRQEQEAKK